MHVLGHLDHFGRLRTIFGPCLFVKYRNVYWSLSIYDLLLSVLVKFHLECWWKCLKSLFTSKPHSLPNELLAKTWCIVPDTNLKGDSTYLKPMLVYKGSKLELSWLCFYNQNDRFNNMCVDTHLLFLTDLSLSATHVEGKINHNAKSLSWSVSKTLHQTFGFQVYKP